MCPQSEYDLERDGGETKIEETGGGPSYLEDALRRLANGHPPLAPVRQMVEILRVINAAEGEEIPVREKLREEVGPCA